MVEIVSTADVLIQIIWQLKISSLISNAEDKACVRRAFKALNAEGFIAKCNFSCCNSCGLCDMDRLARESVANGKAAKGLIFHHVQAHDRMLQTGEVYIAYIAAERSPSSTLEVGRALYSALVSAGLRVEWDGSASAKIKASANDMGNRGTDSNARQ